MWSWLLIALVTWSLAASRETASAQSAPAKRDVTAPTVHPVTGLSFPTNLGGAHLERTLDFGRTNQRPDLGYGYFYAIVSADRIPASIYVYDSGARVPSGADNPAVLTQFEQAHDEIAARDDGRYRNLRTVSGPGPCSYAGVTFRCITFSALTRSNQRVYTKLMLTGYRQNFVKVRIDWPQESAEADGSVERFLQAFAGNFRP